MMTDPAITIITTGPGRVFVYDGTPAVGSLIASRCPDGPATDPYGNSCPAGDSCADGYQLVRMVEIWPGTLLARR